MRKYLFILMTALVAVACADKQEPIAPTPDADQYEFTVAANQEPESRAFLQDLAKIFWNLHDKIALYAKSYNDPNKKATLNAKAVDATSATFSGTGTAPAPTDVFYATYPDDVELTVGGDGAVTAAKFALPAAQDGTTTTPMMAAQTKEVAAADMALTFKPIFAALNIVVSEDVDTILFTAGDGGSVAGTYEYNFASGSAHISGADKSITVTTATDKRNLVVVVPAIHYAAGFRIELRNSRGMMYYNYGKSGIDLGIGKYYEIGTSASPLQFEPIKVELGAVETTYENWGKGGIDANTIYTSGNTFAGAISKSLIEESGIEYTSSDGVTRQQTMSVAATPFNITITGVPSDLYTVRAYVKLKGTGTKIYSAAKSVGVIDSEVKLSLTTESSYSTTTDNVTSVTKNSKFDLGGDGFRAKATLTGVHKVLVKSLDVSSSKGTVTAADVTCTQTADNLAHTQWTNYDVKTSATLKNNQTIDHVTQTAVVTGIPYTIVFNDSDNTKIEDAGWNHSNTTFYQGNLSVYSNDNKNSSYAISPMFNLPQDIAVNYTFIGKYYNSNLISINGSKTVYINFGPTNSKTTASTLVRMDFSQSASTNGNKDTATKTGSFTMTPTNKYISVAGISFKNGTSALYSSQVHTIKIEYTE